MKRELKRKLVTTLMAQALGLSVAGVALAADQSATGSQSSTAKQQRSTSSQDSMTGGEASARAQDLRASKLIGSTVKNAQGETLGKIDDLIVDVQNERVAYAVLASGGIMGLGGKLFAYPVSLFQAGRDKDELLLNVDKDRLAKAPGFDRKSWPEWTKGNDGYRGEVDRYFGPTVTAKSMQNEHLMRASTLIGKDIDDRQGNDSGEIKDLVVNLGNSRVHYAVVDLETGNSKTDKLLPVSLQAFSYPTDAKKDLTLNVARNQFNPAQGLDKKRWRDMNINDPTFKRQIDSQLKSTASSSTASSSSRE